MFQPAVKEDCYGGKSPVVPLNLQPLLGHNLQLAFEVLPFVVPSSWLVE